MFKRCWALWVLDKENHLYVEGDLLKVVLLLSCLLFGGHLHGQRPFVDMLVGCSLDLVCSLTSPNPRLQPFRGFRGVKGFGAFRG